MSALSLSQVSTGYGRIQILHDVDLTVSDGEIVTIVGANGAGKTTLLKAVSGLIPLWRGAVTFKGRSLSRATVEARAGLGLVQIPEGRQLFGPMTVEENLELGAYSRRRNGRPFREKRDEVFALFPRLGERRRQQAGTLSGGEQQMLAIGRALMAEPEMLLLDEPSMGLAPLLVKEIFTTLRELNSRGLGMLLVEQDAMIALKLADRGMVMERGRVVLEDRASALLDNPELQAIYFGQRGGAGGVRTETE